MFEIAVADTTANVRNPVTEKTLSCFWMQTGLGVTTAVKVSESSDFLNQVAPLYLCFFLFLLPISCEVVLLMKRRSVNHWNQFMSILLQ